MRKGTGQLRVENNKKVLDFLKTGVEVTKKEVADSTGLTVATIGTILNDFLKDKILIESERVKSQKGRPTIRYRINPDHHSILSVVFFKRLGKNYLSYTFFNASLDVLEEGEQVVGLFTGEFIYNKIVNLMENHDNTSLLVMSLPAILQDGKVIESEIPALLGWELEEGLEEALGIPVVVNSLSHHAAIGAGNLGKLSYLYFSEQGGPILSGHTDDGNAIEGTITGELNYFPGLRLALRGKLEGNEEKIAEALSVLASLLGRDHIIISGQDSELLDLEKLLRSSKRFLPKQIDFQLAQVSNCLDDVFQGAALQASDYYWTQISS